MPAPKPVSPLERPMPEGGQARELFRDVYTDIAVVQAQAARNVAARHRLEKETEDDNGNKWT